MPAYCPDCGRPLNQVEKANEILPTCNNCQRVFRDAGLGWSGVVTKAYEPDADSVHEAVISVKKLEPD